MSGVIDRCKRKHNALSNRYFQFLTRAVAIVIICQSYVNGVNGFAIPSSGSSMAAQRKTLNQEIGSPSELAWQAWLQLESNPGGSGALDSANLLRRITPKSIFIAPELLVSCPNGYSTDDKGDCKPDPISIDEEAQRQFFLKRLNALYGKGGSGRKKPSSVEPVGGPLQFNIPISSLSSTIKTNVVHDSYNQSLDHISRVQETQQVSKALPPLTDISRVQETQQVSKALPPLTDMEEMSKFEREKIHKTTLSSLGLVNVGSIDQDSDSESTVPKFVNQVAKMTTSPSNAVYFMKKEQKKGLVEKEITPFIDNISQLLTNQTLSTAIDHKATKIGIEKNATLNVNYKLENEHTSEKILDDYLENSSFTFVDTVVTKQSSMLSTTLRPLIKNLSYHRHADYPLLGEDAELYDDYNRMSTTIAINQKTFVTERNDSASLINLKEQEVSSVESVISLNKSKIFMNFQRSTPGSSFEPTNFDTSLEKETEAYKNSNDNQRQEQAQKQEEESTVSNPQTIAYDENYYDTTDDHTEQGDFEGEDELLKPGEANIMVISSMLASKKVEKNRQEEHETTLAEATTTNTIFATPIITITPIVDSLDRVEMNDETGSTINPDIMSTQLTEMTENTVALPFTSPISISQTTNSPRNRRIKPTSTKIVTRIENTTFLVNTKKSYGVDNFRNQPNIPKSLDFSFTKKINFEPPLETASSRPITSMNLRLKNLVNNPAWAKLAVKNSYSWEGRVNNNKQNTDKGIFKTVRTTPLLFKYGDSKRSDRQKSWFSTSSITDDDDDNEDDDGLNNEDVIPSEFKDQLSEFSKLLLFSEDHRQLAQPTTTSRYFNINDDITKDSISSVRFPEHTPEIRSDKDYVRLPSDEVNSINNQETYKDYLLSHYSFKNENLYHRPLLHSNSTTNTRSSTVPMELKSQQHLYQRKEPTTPSGINSGLQQQQPIQSRVGLQLNNFNSNSRKQRPMLLRFWARMPLVRDFSFYSTNNGSHNERNINAPSLDLAANSDQDSRGQLLHQARKLTNSAILNNESGSKRHQNGHYYKELSSRDVNGLLAEHFGAPARK